MKNIFIILLSLFSLQSFAEKKKGPLVRLGGIATTSTNSERILSDPRPVDENDVCTIRSFAIIFQPQGGDTFGPYQTKGNKLTNEEIEILKKLKGSRPVKIVFDNIAVVEKDGQTRSLNDIVLSYTN